MYDALGRQAETHDKLGRITSYTYDEMGRLSKTTHPDLTTEESTYDGEGRRLTSKDRGGRTTTYEYDALGRLKKTTYPDATFTENTYDAVGRLVATGDARGQATSYEYDAAGRRTKVRDPLGHETIFTYDENGNQQTVKDARLNTAAYEYDELNRRTKTIFPPADPASPSTFTLTAYDVLGRRISATDPAGKTTRFRYDALGRLTKVIDPLGQETVYGYDELGNRTLQRDANSHETRFEYDRLGRETARILPDGKRETMTYDPAGNLETGTDFLGRTTTYAYDENNLLLSRSYPNPAENVGFTYSTTGRRLTANDRRGTTRYGYDLRDRLTSLTQPGVGSLGYTYDGNGNRMTLTVTLGSTEYTTSYAYDDGSRLDVVTDPLARAYDFGYDPNGNSTSLAHPNGTLTAYGYDSLNRVRSLTTTVPALGRTIQGYAFTLGAAGNRTRIDEADGTVRDYAYGSLYRLTGERVSEGIGLVYEKSFGYDPVGNRLSQTTTLGPAGSPGPNLQPGTISYGYDGRDRLTLEGAQVYGWDDNGNLLTKDAEATYAWDHENRLVRVQKADGTVVDHVYDADGVRVQTTTTLPGHAPQVTNYLVDTSGSLSQVVVETGGAGALKAYYVRGDDLLAVMRPLVPMPATAADWQTRYMHADGIGSIRRLTDENGQITDGYTYTAFGELLAHTGSDPQPHAFTGEPLDLNSAFQYHRARWYDGRVGRFTGRDPFPGVEEAPATLHRYSYGRNDPVDKVDPTGRFETVATLSVGLSMMNTINAISVPNALAVTPDFMTLHLRSFAPWAVFGTIYKGDNRDFTTSRSKEVTSRIWAYVKFAVRTSRILDRNVGSDPSHQIWPVERVATGTPQMNVTTSGRGLRVDVSGNNPLLPGSADVDIHLNVSANSSGNRTCFSGSMTGDGFPNAEVFVVDRGNRATMIHTYATPADPDTGPYRLLPGDLGRDMGTFANRCH